MQHHHLYEKIKQRAKLLLVSLCCFYALTTLFLLLTDHLTDEFITRWAQQHQHPALHWFSVAMAEVGKPYFVAIKALVPALLLIFYGFRREGIFLIATLIADIANLLLKEIVNRPRPTADVAELLKEAGNPGFPSGHTVNFIVYFGFLLVIMPMARNLSRPLRIFLTVVLLFLIVPGPFSRVYAGMHWPSDIIGGGFFGILFLAMLCYAYLGGAGKK